MHQRVRRPRFVRFGTAVAALTLLFLGVGALVNHAWEYTNYWGGSVFAPFTIVIGSAMLLIVVFRPGLLTEVENKRKRRRRSR